MNEIPLNLERKLLIERDGESRQGFLRINRLYFDPERSRWHCDWSLDHLYTQAVHFAGDDPLAALTRTLDFASSFIRGSTTDGIKIQWRFPGDLGGLDFPQSESGTWKLIPPETDAEK